MSYSSIIFDLDGTLLDTLSDIAETANSVLVHHGFPVHSKQEYKGFVGDGLRALMGRITPLGTHETIIDSCYQLFIQMYSNNWRNNCRPYDGIVDMLAALKQRGFSLAVLSNKPHTFTKLFVDNYFSRDTFIYVYGQSEEFAKKPDPGVALAIAESLGIHPKKMLFVGDTPIDIQTGKASGMMTIAVTWGFRSINELQKEKPDIIINHPKELLQYV